MCRNIIVIIKSCTYNKVSFQSELQLNFINIIKHANVKNVACFDRIICLLHLFLFLSFLLPLVLLLLLPTSPSPHHRGKGSKSARTTNRLQCIIVIFFPCDPLTL